MRKYLVAAFALLMCSITWAGSKPRDYFMFPDAVFTTHGEIIESRFKPSDNWSVEKKEDAPHYFRGSNKGSSGIELTWEFVRRTDHGDVYIICISHPEKGRKKFPLLFDGSDSVEVSAFGAYIKIQNEK